VFEAAAGEILCIVICQNEHEMKHWHITSRYGMLTQVSSIVTKLQSKYFVFEDLRNKFSERTQISERSKSVEDGLGIMKIIGLNEECS